MCTLKYSAHPPKYAHDFDFVKLCRGKASTDATHILPDYFTWHWDNQTIAHYDVIK